MTMRTSPAQLSFSSGEISPLLYRRSDYQRFQTGLRRCNGFLPLRQGGVTRMPGTFYLGQTHENREARLISFKFSEEDSVALEFTDFAMRVWRYGALVESAPGVPYVMVTPYDLAALDRLQYVQSADVIYLVDGVLPPQKLSRFALDNWQIAAWLPENGPFQVEEGDEEYYITASGLSGSITLTASQNTFAPEDVGRLIRLEPESYPNIPIWRADVVLSQNSFVRYGDNIYRLRDSARTGGTPPIHERGIEQTSMEPHGPVVRYEFISKTSGVVRITAVASPTSATVDVLQTLPPALQPGGALVGWPPAPVDEDPDQLTDVDTRYRFSLGAWCDRAGYPAATEIYDQRLCFAATPNEPRTVWFSVVGDYDDFTPGAEADDSFAFAIAGQNSLNKIIWLKSGSRALHIGAIGDEYSTRSDARNVAIGPTTARFGIDSSIGSRPHRPIAPDGQLIFLSRDQRRLFQSRYNLEEDRAQPIELSLPSEHLGKSRFKQLVTQESPSRVVIVLRGDGSLALMLHDPAEDVLGWAPFTLAGGVACAISIETAPETSEDFALLCVCRMIDGAPQYFIEQQAHSLAADPETDPVNYLFAAQRFDFSEPASEISIPHLAGQTVYAALEGGDVQLQVDVDGTLQLPFAASFALVGLFDDTHELETLDVTASAADGNTLGRPKRLHSAGGIAFHQTGQASIETVERELSKPDRIGRPEYLVPVTIPFSNGPLASGVKRLTQPTGHAQEVSYRICPVGNAPLTVTAITPRVQETG